MTGETKVYSVDPYRWTRGTLVGEVLRLRTINAELLAALENLVGHFDAFIEVGNGWGNQEQAYYCLDKGAQDSWAKARAAIKRARENA